MTSVVPIYFGLEFSCQISLSTTSEVSVCSFKFATRRARALLRTWSSHATYIFVHLKNMEKNFCTILIRASHFPLGKQRITRCHVQLIPRNSNSWEPEKKRKFDFANIHTMKSDCQMVNPSLGLRSGAEFNAFIHIEFPISMRIPHF